MLSIFSLACIYGIILGVFLDKISWKVVDYKREQRRQADADKSSDGPKDEQKKGKRSKELSLHCADDRSRKLARILLPI